MGFWDQLGKMAGEVAKNTVETARKATDMKQEFQYLSESELINIYKKARRQNDYVRATAARGVLREKYGYESWQFDGLDF